MQLSLVHLAGAEGQPVLVVGPSLGTSVTALWDRAAQLLGERFHVVGWELPGHGHGAPTTEPFTLADVAAGVVATIDSTLGQVTFAYAGDSVAGAVGLQLALDVPERLTGVAVLCTGAKIGTTESWAERAAVVRASGTPAVVEASAKRWFGSGFLEREPEVGTELLRSLQHADAESYALVTEALGAFDVRERLGEISVPVLAVGGAEDVPTPAATLREHAARIPGARFVELDGVAHLAPAEAPRTVASLVEALVGHDPAPAGMQVRRQVLGDEHVDRAIAGTTEVTADFQDFITRYAWGEIWTRPGLARRDRSIAVLTALVAGRHFEELEFHLRAALRNGLSREEIIEVLLQSAVYIGVPAANTAFGVARRVLAEE
ncbi:bifunctional 3-oxoadipate enol-lactonase/4-carboxymuconolactone decarboxylase PcaDC [Nocardioides sp. Iso805N]|uniref:bifunctional 3-oxoadipate enol-lactonase/4-carboxymuconolactone decarboxylase PcaDC n=1 Tax=Nocardioides sp. Iso805N TaxID=1283287 RepID=UPI000374D252|nr:alpha/beta fold hydrolase [Nocardioides sp. Iso805N]